MQLYLSIITPHTSPLNLQFYLLLAVTLLGVIFCYLLMTNKILHNFKLRGLFGMLLGFIGLVSLGTVILTGVHAQSIKPVEFSENQLQFGSETIAYKEIRRHYIKPLMQQSRYSAQINTDTAIVFVIERSDKKVFLFSNDYYDVRALKLEADKNIDN